MKKISKAVRSDLKQILALQKLAYQSEAAIYNDYHIQPLTQDLQSVEEEFKKGVILKYEIAGKIVGSARAFQHQDVCHIGKLIVQFKYQSKGIGGQLLQAIEAEFNTASTYRLFTGSKSVDNISFYQRRGYRIISKSEVKQNLTLVTLEKH